MARVSKVVVHVESSKDASGHGHKHCHDAKEVFVVVEGRQAVGGQKGCAVALDAIGLRGEVICLGYMFGEYVWSSLRVN